jgi:hypothetical protein
VPAQVVRVSSSLGWAFELAIRASSDVAVHDKYNIAGFLQVRLDLDIVAVTAVLVDMAASLAVRPGSLGRSGVS